MNFTKSSAFNQFIWGNTIGLSWMWGLGLFFSVQITFQFGLLGLLCFAVPNAIGLFLFGFITDRIANKSEDGESLATFFESWSKPFRMPLFLYQVAALSLTIFAVIRYLWAPLGLEPGFIYIPLGGLVVLAATLLFGEEFSIKRIKWSHSVMLAIAVVAIVILLFGKSGVDGARPALFTSGSFNGPESFSSATFLGYLIPIIVGFLVGPWMDIQQWQRAVQIRREGKSITRSYAFGSGLFFLLLMFHGLLANWALTQGAGEFARSGLLQQFTYGHQVLTEFFFAKIDTNPVLFAAYATFICICILTTLDSGYIALRWFFTSCFAKSQNMILTLLPPKLLTSPVPTFLLVITIAFLAYIFPNLNFQAPLRIDPENLKLEYLMVLFGSIFVGLELEYFMILFGSFFVAYSALGMTRTWRGKTDLPIPQIKMFCVGALSVVVFAFGYLQNISFFMACGALIPLSYISWLLIKSHTPAESREELTVKTTAKESKPAAAVAEKPESKPAATPASNPAKVTPAEPADAKNAAEYMTPEVLAAIAAQQAPTEDGVAINQSPTGYFEGKTFVHSFLSTYADTNSVGNVYFGMYAMWVGKARELFMRKVFPEFDLETTEFLILTRSFEHKFVREAKEFEEIRVEISVGEHNRKFVELNHKVLDGTNKVLGKGKQTLMFVSSKDYGLLDIPLQILKAFAYYAPSLAPTLKR